MPSLTARAAVACSPLMFMLVVAGAGSAMADDAGADEPGSGSMTPFQAALFSPLQIFREGTSVRGLRVSLLYGKQASVWGVDLGPVNQTTADWLGLQVGGANWNESSVGLQSGIVFNRVGGDFAGIQQAPFNVVEGELVGSQNGIINWQGGDLYGFQTGLFNVPLGDEQSLVAGLRLNLVLGYQARFWGLDLGLFNMTKSEMRGLQLGFANANLGSATGVQLGLSNSVEGDFWGFEMGAANIVQGKGSSVQLGVANSTAGRTHFQFGLINSAQSLKGVQIGALNFNASRSPILFSPVVNVGW